jgi:hypothetical protein
LVVFQMPPLAAATYQVEASRGSTAMSITRPEVMAGPIERSSSPAKVSAENGSLGFSGSVFFFSAAASGRARLSTARARANLDFMDPPAELAAD